MNTPMRKIYNKLPQIVGICILTATAGCKDNATLRVSEDATSRVSEDSPPRTLRGSFDVYYSVQTSATEGEGTGTTPKKVQAILLTSLMGSQPMSVPSLRSRDGCGGTPPCS